jgi:hypothetical protein
LSHDVSDVFNSTFVPSTAESTLLFKAKQEFVYSVFNRCVQTDTGKSIVREHEHDYNAQAVYTKLVQQATTSTKAKLSRDKLVIELTTSLLDSTWRGTHEGFVLMWKEKMRLLEDMTSSQYHYADEVKLSMLQNAVSLVSKLSQIRDINDNLVAVGSLPLDYTTYSDMLISACNQLDKDLEVPRNSKSNRTVNYSHFKEEDYFEQGYLDAGDEFFSKDKEQQDQRDISLHQAWTVLAAESSAHESGKGMPFLPKDLWNQIPEAVREYIRANWDPNLRRSNTNVPSNRGPPRREPYNRDQRRVNFHEFPEENREEEGTDEFHDALTKTPDEDLADPRTNPIMARIKDQASPVTGSLRHLLANTHTTAKSVEQPSHKRIMVIDGKRFIETNIHRVWYRFSEAAAETNRDNVASLVDRGANGGLAGEDVRVIKHTHRKADISGINNHTVVGLPIITAAGVVNTQAGPVCVILHQYALLGKGKSIHSSVQMECHDIVVDEKSRKLRQGGQQCLTTVEGYKIPLSIRRGLPYMDMYPPSDHELDSLPHVVLTSDADWDPTMADNEIDSGDVWYDALDTEPPPGTSAYGDTKFD